MRKKKLTNLAGECPFCQSTNLEYGVIELEGDMIYYPWECKDCGHQGEEWYSLTFAGHNVEVDDIGTMEEVDEVNKEAEETGEEEKGGE